MTGTLQPGERLGGYEVRGFIASGGMAEIYRVLDERTGDRHALKLLTDDSDRAMFDREYEVMNRLNHPGVVRTWRYGSHEGRPWFSMELLRGLPAHKHARQVGAPGTPERTREAIALTGLTARALAYVHSRGVVHRDLKPANLVVLPDQRVRLVDFGVAHLMGFEDPFTAAGGFVGTPGYAAPEMIRGQPVGAKSDLYALGAFLYRMLSGRLPFKADTAEATFDRQLSGDYEDLRELISVPDQVAELIASLLAIDPADRPRSGRVVADRLDTIAGATILPGTSLALYESRATDPDEVLGHLFASAQPLAVLRTDDGQLRRELLDFARDSLTARKVHAVRVDGDLDPIASISDALRILSDSAPDPGRPLAEQLAIHSATHAHLTLLVDCDGDLDPLRQLAEDCKGAGAQLRIVCATHDAHPPDPSHIRLPPFDVHDGALRLAWMIGRKPPTGQLAHALHRATAGYPSALAEVARHLAASDEVRTEGNQVLWARHPIRIEIPPSLTEQLAARIRGRPKAERLVLQATARAGSITRDALAGVLPSPTALAEGVDALVAHGLLVEAEDGMLSLPSEALAHVALTSPGGFPKSALDRMLTAVVDRLPPTPLRIHLLAQGGDLAQAIAEAIPRAEAMILDGNWQEARAVLEPVLGAVDGKRKAPPRASEACLLLARCASSLHESALANRCVANARRLATGPEVVARVELAAATNHRAIGHYGRYRSHLAAAWELARDSDNPELRTRVGLAHAHAHLASGESRTAVRILEDLDAGHAAVPTNLEARVLAALARADATTGRLVDAAATARRALELAPTDPAALAEATLSLGLVQRRQGQLSAALQTLAAGTAACRFHPDPRPYLELLLALGWVEVDLHRLGPAQDCVDDLAGAIGRTELLHLRLEGQLLEARVHLLSGDVRTATRQLRLVAEAAEAAGLARVASRARAFLFQAQGDKVDAQALDRWFESRRIGFMASRDIWLFAEACITLYQLRKPTPDPDAVFAKLEEALQGERAPTLEVELALARAEHARRTGDRAGRIRHSRQAGKLLAELVAGLDESERGAMRVHPWGHRIRAALSAG